MKRLEKPALFPNNKSFILFGLILVLLLGIHLGFEYKNYQNFINKPFYYTYAKVITAYEKTKNKKRYQVLKLRSDEGFVFYTTSYGKDDFNHKRLRLQIFPSENISFQDYLSIFYVRSKIKYQVSMPLTLKDTLLENISSQHQDKDLQSFYNAIFFATTLSPKLREKISMLGVSHLVALSGFHLSILWALVYGLLLLLYSPLQQKVFPYRHALFDVGIVGMLLLGAYLWFVDFPPSLLRSYAMVFVGWVMLLLGVELLSFKFLFTIFLVLATVFPSLLFSLSFGLSVAGVFYIFLLLQYTKDFNVWLISLVFIPFGIFILMLPIVHGIFGMTSEYQLLSPFLSLIFIVFYPLVIFAHVLSFGAVLDDILLTLFSLPSKGKEILLPLGFVYGYILLSLVAIAKRKGFYLLLLCAVLYMLYLFVPIE
ncbi:MAG: ComEC/Rec2 family competence protein [Epsilonproteobacteria bacterium]|nr:MAG: ComEC/Rec2 family competence protein [Campylobacterota bacterium]